MKSIKLLILNLILLIGFSSSDAQFVLRNNAELKVSLPFTQESGTNGAAVAFNPAENVYYAVIAGNEEYPLEKFDLNGKSISSGIAGTDVRGMWWNSKTKSLEVNAFSELGYYRIDLDENGDPLGNATCLISGQNQPSEQSAGAFNSAKQKIYFYSDGAIYTYSRKNGKAGKKITFPVIPVEMESVNYTSLIYTDIKGIEFGLLNYVDSEVLFFDKKTGNFSGSVKFEHNAPMNDAFRFSFANNLVWLYNAEYRIWYGYEIFR